MFGRSLVPHKGFALFVALMLPYLKVYFIVPVANYEEKMMTVGEEVKEPQVDTDTYFIWFSAFSRVK